MTPEQFMNSLPYLSAALIGTGFVGMSFAIFGRKKQPKGAAAGDGTPITESAAAPAYVTEDVPAPEAPAAPAPAPDEQAAPRDEYGEPITLPGLPLLGVIPALTDGERAAGYLPLLGRQPADSAQAAEYRRVWERMGVEPKDPAEDETGGRAVRLLAVAGPQVGEGASLATANLAAAAARMGYSVLVVDADLASPAQHLLLGAPWTPGAPGLGDVLARTPGVPAVEELARPTAVQGVRLIPAGSLPPGMDGAALFASPQAARFILSQAPALADIVLFDTPPVFGGGPGAQVVAQVSGVILIVDSDRRDPARVRQTLRGLEREGASMLGGLVVPAPSPASETVAAYPPPAEAAVEEVAVPATAEVPTAEYPAEDGEPEVVAEDIAAEEAAEADEEDDEPQTVESVRAEMAATAPETAPPPVPPAEAPSKPLFLSDPGSAGRRKPGGGGGEPGDVRKVLDTIPAERITPIYDVGKRPGNALAATGFAFSPAADDEDNEEEADEAAEEAQATVEEAAEADDAPPVMDVDSATEANFAATAETEEEIEFAAPAAPAPEAVAVVEPDPFPPVAAPEPEADAEAVLAPALVAAPEPEREETPVVAAPTPTTDIAPAPAPVLTPSAPMPVRKPDVMLEVLAAPDAGTTLRATTTAAAAAPAADGALTRTAPRVLLEITTKPGEAMSMRAGTPTNGGLGVTASADPDAPDVLLETTTRHEAPDAATMRLLVMEDGTAGAAANAPSGTTVLEASMQKPEAMTIRSGQSGDIGVRFEMNSEQNGGTRFRATVVGQADEPAMLLEMERSLVEEPVPDGTAGVPEKRWRNRVTLRTVDRK
jgi:Mrp family chromosome partitioning ATPase